LKADGSVVAWGFQRFRRDHGSGHSHERCGHRRSGEHSLALKADGSVVAWGKNTSGQTTVPATAKNVVAIAAGGTTVWH